MSWFSDFVRDPGHTVADAIFDASDSLEGNIRDSANPLFDAAESIHGNISDIGAAMEDWHIENWLGSRQITEWFEDNPEVLPAVVIAGLSYVTGGVAAGAWGAGGAGLTGAGLSAATGATTGAVMTATLKGKQLTAKDLLSAIAVGAVGGAATKWGGKDFGKFSSLAARTVVKAANGEEIKLADMATRELLKSAVGFSSDQVYKAMAEEIGWHDRTDGEMTLGDYLSRTPMGDVDFEEAVIGLDENTDFDVLAGVRTEFPDLDIAPKNVTTETDQATAAGGRAMGLDYDDSDYGSDWEDFDTGYELPNFDVPETPSFGDMDLDAGFGTSATDLLAGASGDSFPSLGDGGDNAFGGGGDYSFSLDPDEEFDMLMGTANEESKSLFETLKTVGGKVSDWVLKNPLTALKAATVLAGGVGAYNAIENAPSPQAWTPSESVPDIMGRITAQTPKQDFNVQRPERPDFSRPQRSLQNDSYLNYMPKAQGLIPQTPNIDDLLNGG